MMYCNLEQKENTDTDSATYQRFDWIKVVGRSNGIYVQLCCLMELVSKDAQGKTSSTLLYVAAETTDVPNSTGLSCPNVFPQIKYRFNRNLQIYCVCDHVDSILEPACVVPLSIIQKDYLKSNKNTIGKIIFHTVPFGYIFRDDWGDTIHNSFEDLQRTVHSAKTVKLYLKANKINRARLFEELQQTLNRNSTSVKP